MRADNAVRKVQLAEATSEGAAGRDWQVARDSGGRTAQRCLVRVDADVLDRQLGEDASVLWSMLRGLRDHGERDDGIVYVSRKGMARPRWSRGTYGPTSARRVKRALGRLREARLVEPVGNARIGKARVFEHLVLGRVVPARARGKRGLELVEPGPGAWVPAGTRAWMKEHPMAGTTGGRPKGSRDKKARRSGSGGARPGAGRPLGSRDRAPRQSKKGGLLVGRENQKRVGPRIDLGSRYQVGSSGACVSPPPASPEKKIRPAGAAPPLAGSSSLPGRPRTAEELDDALSIASVGAALGRPSAAPSEAVRRLSTCGSYLDGLPPYPGLDVVCPARVPSPPLLDPEAAEADQVEALVAVYRSAYRATFGKVAPLRRGAEKQGSALYGRLARTARVLGDNGMAPAWWAVWSFELWREYVGDSGRLPSAKWVLDPARALEQSGRFLRDVGEWRDTYQQAGPAYRRLVHRYGRMLADVRTEQAATLEERAAIAERHFPGGAYDEMVAEARAETARTERLLREGAREGRYLWD